MREEIVMRTVSKSVAKIATAIGAAALALSIAAGSALAARGGGGGGGGGHPGGGGGHPGGGGGAGRAFGGGGRPSFGGGGRPAFGGAGHPAFVTHGAGIPHFSRGAGTHIHVGRGVGTHVHVGNGVHTGTGRRFVHTHGNPAISHATGSGAHTNVSAAASHIHGPIDPHSFAANRRFAAAGGGAFRPFIGPHWFFHHHYGWIGPWFWPYAYGDFFYYALWPYDYAYYDPFWYYGYDDIYEGIFTPYDYQPYVQGPGAPARMRQLTQAVAQSCTDEAAEVTNWPIDQIQAAVQPNQQQSALLDDLGNAIVKASDVIKSHCPTRVSFTPTDRLADEQTRLEGLVQAVNIVQPPLAKFYDSLSDEQKARFNDIGAQTGQPSAQAKQAANPQAGCTESVMAFPTDQIDHTVQPSDAQQSKLQALAAATAKAADLIKASCPSQVPATPPDRLAAEGAHLQAMLQAVQMIRPPLDDFYNSLSDEQKARFNTLGRQLFAEQ